MRAEVIKFYSDIPAGTVGYVTKQWSYGSTNWYKIYFGKNLSGKKLYKSFPQSVIKLHEEERNQAG